MNQSEDENPSSSLIGGLLIEDLVRSAFFGFVFGAVLFVVSDQTGIVQRTLSWMGFLSASRYLGVKELAIFGMGLGVTLGLAGQLFGRGVSRLMSSWGKGAGPVDS
ncbi:hypothetical protein [Salinibacter altiplanensis]|uniref:hypothetical protein n=1 Tax=Salinibacter altiplanensis TaxID=1803181 RepID=UPI000C9F5B3D|nr:hypothetical protein [Salinibacter altiplanensis]